MVSKDREYPVFTSPQMTNIVGTVIPKIKVKVAEIIRILNSPIVSSTKLNLTIHIIRIIQRQPAL